jgi:hypothetical protein
MNKDERTPEQTEFEEAVSEDKVLVVGTAANGQLAVAMRLFNDIDFEGLNSIIDKLGDNSSDLSKEEKQSAVEVVDEWQNTVVTRLRDKTTQTEHIIYFFESICDDAKNAFPKSQQKYLAECSDTISLYEAYSAAKEQVAVKKFEKPSAYVEDPDLSINANMLARKDTEKLLLIYEHEMKKLNRAANKAAADWKAAMLKNEGIKKLIEDAKTYLKTLKEMKAECSNKSNLAKLGINVSSKDTREALKELLAFAKDIK